MRATSRRASPPERWPAAVYSGRTSVRALRFGNLQAAKPGVVIESKPIIIPQKIITFNNQNLPLGFGRAERELGNFTIHLPSDEGGPGGNHLRVPEKRPGTKTAYFCSDDDDAHTHKRTLPKKRHTFLRLLLSPVRRENILSEFHSLAHRNRILPCGKPFHGLPGIEREYLRRVSGELCTDFP